MLFRDATESDIPAILAIYAPYVQNTTYSFEYSPPSLEEFTKRFQKITARFPWLVCEIDSKIVGYAYASPAFERAAFQWDADLSIYLLPTHRGLGIGKRFYALLESRLLKMGFHNVYALVTGENQTSCQFHEALGYTLLGTFPQIGYKHEKWLDLYWYGKRLQSPTPPI